MHRGTPLLVGDLPILFMLAADSRRLPMVIAHNRNAFDPVSSRPLDKLPDKPGQAGRAPDYPSLASVGRIQKLRIIVAISVYAGKMPAAG